MSQHTLENVFAVLQSAEFNVPIGWEPFAGVGKAIDVFVGYLMLDARIGNTDRHHENWALVVSPKTTIHLAPSYDQASSLGTYETDVNRQDRLTTRDTRRTMTRYVARATSAFFASPLDKKPMYTVDAFREAGIRRPGAAEAWLKRLAQVSCQDVQAIFVQMPLDRISTVATEFALKMLTLNCQRLLTLQEVFG